MSDPKLIPSLISGGLNAIGNIGQGFINQQMQRETNAMQVNLANTAMQRRARDLQKAGINPLMAGKIGGAETPTLQSPQMSGMGEAGRALGDIPANSLKLQEQQMRIQQITAETEKTKADKDAAIAKALYDRTQADLAPGLAQSTIGLNTQKVSESESAIKLQEQHGKLAEAQKAESEARTLTENMKRDPNMRMAIAQATSAEWKAKADQYLPTIEKAKSMNASAEAAWAQATSEAKAKQANALAQIAVNDLVKSGQLVDNEIAKERAKFAILTSKSGQEALALQLAQATYGANVARPYVDTILKGLQAASIGKDLIMPSASTGMSNQMYKAWGW